MNSENIKILASKLGATRLGLNNPNWVRMSCIFAPWRHKPGSTDKHISFAVKVADFDISSYHCFTCKESGNLSNIFDRLREIARATGSRNPYAPDIEHFILENNKPDFECLREGFGSSTKGSIDKKVEDYYPSRDKTEVSVAGLTIGYGHKSSIKEKIPEPISESILTSSFTPLSDEATNYLLNTRNLTASTIKTFELCWHPAARRIGIPIRSQDGLLMGVSGRAIDPDTDMRWLHSKDFPRNFLLYGENLCQTAAVQYSVEVQNRTGYLVEGFFDVHHLYELGYRNVVAMMGTYLSDFQQRKIVNMFDTLYVATDGDKAGYEGASRIFDQLNSRITVKIGNVPEGMDPDDFTKEQALQIIGPPTI